MLLVAFWGHTLVLKNNPEARWLSPDWRGIKQMTSVETLNLVCDGECDYIQQLTVLHKTWSQKELIWATSCIFLLFSLSRNLHQLKFWSMNLNLIRIISMSLLRGELSLKRKYTVNKKTYEQHCFLAVSFHFTSYLMKNAIKNNVRKST